MSSFVVLWRYVGVAIFASSCSLVVDDRAEQCTSAADCTRFGNARCDSVTLTCKDNGNGDTPPGEAPMIEDGGTGGRTDAAGTNPSAPSRDGGSMSNVPEAGCATRERGSTLNACTNARCRAFDNRARLKKLAADGGLAPLPPPRDGGAGSP